MSVILWALGSAIAVSIISLLAAIPLLSVKKVPKKLLIVLLSISVGTLLGLVFFELVPEIYSAESHEAHAHELHEMHNETLQELHNETQEHNETETEHHEEEHHEEEVHSSEAILSSMLILGGFLVFFVLEKLVHHNHRHKHDEPGHSHGYHLAAVNLVGDAVHNFIDGLVIAATYAVSIPLGIATTIGVLLHELPQEIADMGVLLYAGISKTKALLYNVGVGITAILGTVVGLFLLRAEGFIDVALPFAAGMFIYIAASNLVPELHRECGWKESLLHIVSIMAGVGIILLVVLFVPHSH